MGAHRRSLPGPVLPAAPHLPENTPVGHTQRPPCAGGSGPDVARAPLPSRSRADANSQTPFPHPTRGRPGRRVRGSPRPLGTFCLPARLPLRGPAPWPHSAGSPRATPHRPPEAVRQVLPEGLPAPPCPPPHGRRPALARVSVFCPVCGVIGLRPSRRPNEPFLFLWGFVPVLGLAPGR